MAVGVKVGVAVGEKVGLAVGDAVGFAVGANVGGEVQDLQTRPSASVHSHSLQSFSVSSLSLHPYRTSVTLSSKIQPGFGSQIISPSQQIFWVHVVVASSLQRHTLQLL